VQQDEKAPKTARVYEGRVRQIEAWLSESGRPPLRHASRQDVFDFGQQLKWSYPVRDGFRSAIAAYWRYAGRKDCPTKAIRRPKKPAMVCRALEAGGIHRVLAACADLGDRVHAAACLLYYAGLRVSECAALEWSAVRDDLAEPELRIIGKGSKPETIEIDERVLDALSRVSPEDRSASAYVFPGRYPGTHVHPNTIERWITQAGYMALGLHVTPHILRHTIGADMNDNGGELRAVQAHMRHADPRTTSGYTRATKQRRRDLLRLV
jgi:integrase